jgi:hypothetical protein
MAPINPYPANVENMASTNNNSIWQMGFNSAFKGLKHDYTLSQNIKTKCKS